MSSNKRSCLNLFTQDDFNDNQKSKRNKNDNNQPSESNKRENEIQNLFDIDDKFNSTDHKKEHIFIKEEILHDKNYDEINLTPESKEFFRIKELLNFDSEFIDEIKEKENQDERLDRFLSSFLELTVKSPSVTYAFMDEVLKLLRKELLPNIPISHKTLINRFARDSLQYEYYITCNKKLKDDEQCENLILIKKNDISKTINCNKCQNKIEFKNHIQENNHTCSFSLKDQLNKITESTTNDKLLKPITDRTEEYEVELILTADSAPLSQSSTQNVLPLIIYIDNLKTPYLINKFPIHKTVTVLANKSKFNYYQLLQPLIDELNDLSNGFKTNWSDKTKLKVKLIIADAPMRAIIINFLQFNGTYPCHRCLIVYKKDKRFPVVTSDKLIIRKKEDVSDCVNKLESLKAQAKTKTEKKS